MHRSAPKYGIRISDLKKKDAEPINEDLDSVKLDESDAWLARKKDAFERK